MDPVKRIRSQFGASAELAQACADAIAAPLARACNLMTESLFADGRIVACGDGIAAPLAGRLVAALVAGYARERPELPAVALAADPAVAAALLDGQPAEQAYGRAVRALGARGDVLFAVSASAHAPAVLAAVAAARDRDLRVVALTGEGAQRFAELLGEGDVHVKVPAAHPARVAEMQLIALHCLCDAIDHTLLGDDG